MAYLTYWNNYDHQVYAVGKGPSTMTVEVTNDVVQSGSSVMIKGTVTDISAGTKQDRTSMHASPTEFQQSLTKAKAHGWNTSTCKSHAQQTQPV